MNHTRFRAERILHAFVDGELSVSEKQRMLSRLEADERSRQRVCDLQRTKEWVRCSFEGEYAPTHTLPYTHRWACSRAVVRVAASVALMALVFGAGWIGRGLQTPQHGQVALESIAPQARHLILQIGQSDEVRFAALLQKTEEILNTYSAQGVQVEVVTNAGGLDLVRTAASKQIDSIRQMIARYPNVHFIACSKGLDRLRQAGKDASVIEGVYDGEAAADHLIQRLTEGWTLIQI